MTKVWRSGSAWVATLIAQAIAEQNVSVAFVAPLSEPIAREPKHPLLVRIVTPRELINGEPRLQRALASLRRIFWSLWSVAALRISTRTFLFTIPEPLPFTLVLFIFLRASGAKVIFIAHDAQPHAWYYRGIARTLERSGHSLIYRLASTIVVLAPSTMTSLASDFQVPMAKIKVIPHGPFIIDDVGPVPGSRKLLLFGSLRRNKCVLEVISAIVALRRTGVDVTLVLAGEPLKQEFEYWNECVAATQADPEGFDMQIGFVPDEDLPAIIRGIDAFVLAYKGFDSQSGVGVLASLARRPVIASSSGGLGELFALGMTGEMIQGEVSVESVSASILRFLAVPANEWAVAADVGTRKITESLNWDSIASQYIALIDRSD